MKCNCVDRLSFLHDDIRIKIISLLPLQLAIVTSCLSTRWRGLWKNVTSIDITTRESETMFKFFTTFSNIMSQFKSPFIHSLTLNIGRFEGARHPDTDYFSWLREICYRNVCEIKLTWTDRRHYIMLPCFVFQTPSLVSIKFESNIYWELPGTIYLPNLKYLSLTFQTGQCNCVSKLVKACPSLVELSLDSDFFTTPSILRLSNSNLIRLALNLGSSEDIKLVITSPKLEYLAISVPSSVKLNFEEEPLELREAKINLNGYGNYAIKFNCPNANVIRVLTLDDVYTLRNTSSVFCNATQVTLNLDTFYNIEDVLALMKLCPVLDDLYLNYSNVNHFIEKSSVLLKGVLLRGLQKITITLSSQDYSNYKPLKSCLKLVDYLLSNAVNLKHFRFRVDLDNRCETWVAMRRRRRELIFCKLLYNCPTVPEGCEVEFKGVYLNMSRKLGPKAWTTDGAVITLDHSPWNGFILD